MAAQPAVNMDCLKEYHVWDAKFSELGKGFCPRYNPNNVNDAFRRLPQSKDENDGICFRERVHQSVRITGDIMLSYTGLASSAFRQVKTLLEGFGSKVGVIFHMCSTFERLWFALRMHSGRSSTKFNPLPNATHFAKLPKAITNGLHRLRRGYVSAPRNQQTLLT